MDLGRVWSRRPRLDAWLADAGLAVGLAVGAGAQLLAEEPGAYSRLLPVLGIELLLAWRRRYPLAVQLLQIALAILSMRQPVTFSFVALFVGVYSVGRYSRWRNAYPIVPAVGAASLYVLVPYSAPSVPSWVLELAGGLGVWLVGRWVRDRQVQVERERELALAEERRRIARELHDIVAHSVSVMVVQAGAARMVVSRRPEQATQALLAVETAGREALAELRHLLGLLTDQAGGPDGAAQAAAGPRGDPELLPHAAAGPRGDPGLLPHAAAGPRGDPALAPQPGLDQLERLVERVRQAGLDIHLRIEGTRRPLAPGLDLAAYRIVQEALTNALKYASGARADVVLAFDRDALRIQVRDAGGSPAPGAGGAGRGLRLMRERAALYGGTVQAGPLAGGGFEVRAALPLDAAPVAVADAG